MLELEKSSPMTASTASGEACISSSGYQTTPLAAPPPKKKRNLPGMPGEISKPKLSILFIFFG
jgi:hypothetical protein